MTGVGSIIKRRRIELGLTQQEVAEQVGISRQYVAEIEAGRRKPTLATLERLFLVLGLSLQVKTQSDGGNA
uniref:XRE family transcriptional regulator n=1 Tax=Thermus caliditerrae TaxID=1330700 RepID=A0A7C5RDL7_9DEIN